MQDITIAAETYVPGRISSSVIATDHNHNPFWNNHCSFPDEDGFPGEDDEEDEA